MSSKLNMDDWSMSHATAAAAQGWCMSEVGLPTTAHYVEIQRIDDADITSTSWGIQIPQLEDDAQAVQALQAAWQRAEPHAELAYQILKMHSPSEFEFWHMANWSRN